MYIKRYFYFFKDYRSLKLTVFFNLHYKYILKIICYLNVWVPGDKYSVRQIDNLGREHWHYSNLREVSKHIGDPNRPLFVHHN